MSAPSLALESGAPAAIKHPRGLPVLFFAEMWERFSFYGMRAILVLYLVNAAGYTRENALALYATYTGLVYLTPIIGGYLADRYLGLRRAILIGGITMALGHFAMAIPGLITIALGLLIIGNGLFKPNISTLVGQLYQENDPRRDGGFTIFYMGINIGAFLGITIAGYLGEKVGWHYGFAAAGVGMVAGLIVFSVFQQRLGGAGFFGNQQRLAQPDWLTVMAVSAANVVVVLAALWLWRFVGPWWQTLGPVRLGLLIAVVLAWVGSRIGAAKPTREEWKSIGAIFIISFFVIFFWMGFEQAGGTMNLFADKQTDRHAFGWEIPAAWFQNINPLGIFLLAPFFSLLWVRLDRSRFALSSPAKQAIGMIILGLGFVILAIAQTRADSIGRVGPWWLASAVLLHTIGELCLSPVGLSMVTKIAPARLGALMMGLWFGSTALANYLAGTLESLLKGSGVPLYWFLVATSIGAGLVLLLLSPWLKRLTAGKA